MKTNEVLENIKARRSVRAYTDRQVSEVRLTGYSGSCHFCTQWDAFGDMAFYRYSECR